ncbi:hypothetical protein [Lentzea sp.]|uniref:hypothetical protein n=1 Tax=Lentzea sp. TaxID=56099 RepID=UPI002D098A3E|nr:hypothetical protein [Lentzea sp.]HUQ59114.1 hypothetical protein [Lentzea sp.]
MSNVGEQARARHRSAVVVGVVVLALVAWFVVPRALGWSGRWVPSFVETFWLLPLLVAAVCGARLVVMGRLPGLLALSAMVVCGLVVAGVVAVVQMEAPPGDEGVLPGPQGLRVVEGDGWCGSGGCSRDADAAGDRAHEMMRAHLASHGYTAARPLYGDERMCRRTGLVAVREVCAELKDVSVTSVHVTWYVN